MDFNSSSFFPPPPPTSNFPVISPLIAPFISAEVAERHTLLVSVCCCSSRSSTSSSFTHSLSLPLLPLALLFDRLFRPLQPPHPLPSLSPVLLRRLPALLSSPPHCHPSIKTLADGPELLCASRSRLLISCPPVRSGGQLKSVCSPPCFSSLPVCTRTLRGH